MTLQDRSSLPTERVAGGRRQPLFVVFVALALVAVLAWKPWDRPTAVSPGPTLAAFPTNQTPPPTTQPTPTVEPQRTPAILEIEVGQIFDPGYAVFQCTFPKVGADGTLSSIAFGGPTIEFTLDDNRVRYLSWHAEIQANRIDKVFEADWQTILESAPQSQPAANVDFVWFQPTRIDWDLQNDPLMVLRPTFVVEWQDRRHKAIGSAQFTPTTFASNPEGFRVVGGCRTIT